MMLKVSNLSKHFGGLKALNDCNIEVKKGKVTAVIGPNGSGKSTLFNVISSLVKQNKGKITFDGQDITNMKDYAIAKKGISRTFQEVRLFRNLTIQDHLEIAMTQDDESLFKSIKGKSHKEKKEREKQCNKILPLVHLNKQLHTYATELSYGQRKLLDLAIAIAKPHTLLMLDEPVAGVNPKLRVVIKDIIKDLNKKGETILIIEHDMNFVMDLADHVIVLDEGKKLVEGTPKKVQNNKKVLEAYLGE